MNALILAAAISLMNVVGVYDSQTWCCMGWSTSNAPWNSSAIPGFLGAPANATTTLANNSGIFVVVSTWIVNPDGSIRFVRGPELMGPRITFDTIALTDNDRNAVAYIVWCPSGATPTFIPINPGYRAGCD